MIDIVYKESLKPENANRINSGVAKLVELLNKPDKRHITLKDFSEEIGLTFKQFAEPLKQN